MFSGGTWIMLKYKNKGVVHNQEIHVEFDGTVYSRMIPLGNFKVTRRFETMHKRIYFQKYN